VVTALDASGCGANSPSTSPSTPRSAAFFDLDKTVIATSSARAFSKSFFDQGLLNRRAVLTSSYTQFLLLMSGADHDQMDRVRSIRDTHVRRMGRRAGQGGRRRDAPRHRRPQLWRPRRRS